MSISHLDIQLDFLESQCRDAQAGLLDKSPMAVQSSVAALQRLAVEFIQIVDEVGLVQCGSPSRIQRIRALSSGVATLRENLLRRLAYVERGLEIVVPATREKATYAGAGAYGRPVRQSGAFSVLSA